MILIMKCVNGGAEGVAKLMLDFFHAPSFMFGFELEHLNDAKPPAILFLSWPLVMCFLMMFQVEDSMVKE